MSDHRPTASIIVRCLNERDNLVRLFSTLARQRPSGFEVIIVDSGSTDGSLELAKKQANKVVTIAPNDFSFGASLNLGCKKAQADHLVILSAHAFPIGDNFVNLMLKPFSQYPKVGIVYGKQRGNDGTKFSEERIFRKWFPENSEGIQDHAFSNNAACAVRRSVWHELKYDETLTGLEDIDFAERARKVGYDVFYQPKATVEHVHNEIFRQTFNRYRREALALKSIHPGEGFSLHQFATLFGRNIWADMRSALKRGCLSEVFFSILQFRFAQFFGTYRGFQTKESRVAKIRQRLYYPDSGGDE